MAGIYPSNIITPDHLPQIVGNIDKLREAIREDALLSAAGHPDPARTKRLADLMDKMLTFKSVYFPGH